MQVNRTATSGALAAALMTSNNDTISNNSRVCTNNNTLSTKHILFYVISIFYSHDEITQNFMSLVSSPSSSFFFFPFLLSTLFHSVATALVEPVSTLINRSFNCSKNIEINYCALMSRFVSQTINLAQKIVPLQYYLDIVVQNNSVTL